MTDEFGVPDKGRDGNGPSSELEIYRDVLASTNSDQFLSETNFGLGNYSDSEMWQQIESYEKGMFADAAFGDRLLNRAIEQTKTQLALNGIEYQTEEGKVSKLGWVDLDAEDRKELWENKKEDRRRFVDRRKEEIWDDLPAPVKESALEEVTGLTSSWTPPFWRMMTARHEASRSRGARLQDNFFNRVTELKGQAVEQAKRKLAGFRSE